MKAFCKEIVSILKSNKDYKEIGIRGDCVYAIYSVNLKKENVFDKIIHNALVINTFHKMFKKILEKKQQPTFEIGIGIGCSETTIVKAGTKSKKRGINSKVWIGNSVVNASKLSSIGNRKLDFKVKTIVIDQEFFNRIKDLKLNDWIKISQKDEKDSCYKNIFKQLDEKEIKKILNDDTKVYHSDETIKDFENWINESINKNEK
ncbi:hypothetical protein DMC14_003250 [Metamycoplasma phocicerebrale]|uniref:Guanylate cyclase domain-containing protein n=1 Tax=Metamycoplasma phocicerebrale TaxID=142649 RepID=A0A3Q9V3J0_9BACT|nr:hypothetical protein [Metamycoplasma phocicerebrale]AZZ65780.1 hypothetical protein DMC14_003250 [Metamycoplasma phocicerebrale]